VEFNFLNAVATLTSVSFENRIRSLNLRRPWKRLFNRFEPALKNQAGMGWENKCCLFYSSHILFSHPSLAWILMSARRKRLNLLNRIFKATSN